MKKGGVFLKSMSFVIFVFFTNLYEKAEADQIVSTRSEVIDFFDATIFQDKSNTIGFVPRPISVNGRKVPYRAYLEEVGTFVEGSSEYFDDIKKSYFGRPHVFQVWRSSKLNEVKNIKIFGLQNQKGNQIAKAFSSYKKFIGEDDAVSMDEFRRIDFAETCFVRVINKIEGRKTFVAILYDQDDGVSEDYKKRVSACYFGAFYVQMGVWPLKVEQMNFFIKKQEENNSGNKYSSSYVFNPQSIYVEAPFHNDVVEEGMGRYDFLRVVDKIFSGEIKIN